MALTNEDLLAISQLLDVKSDAKMQTIESHVILNKNRQELILSLKMKLKNNVYFLNGFTRYFKCAPSMGAI